MTLGAHGPLLSDGQIWRQDGESCASLSLSSCGIDVLLQETNWNRSE
jgi:hypothetical protein